MTLDSIARRYASALYDVARKSGHLEAVARDLAGLGSLIASHEELRRVFDTPGIPAARKRALIEGLVAASHDLSDEVRRLLLMLADRDRLLVVGRIVDAFAARLRAAQRVLPAEIVTAVPLGDARRAALARALGDATGGTVTVTERIDPAIIGGVVAKVGGLVFDGSVTRHIDRLRQRLLART